MKTTKSRLTGAAVAIAVAGTTAFGATTSSAQKYQTPKPAKKVTIEMVAKGKKLLFTGPSKVAKGQKLEIVSLTDARKVGPHTASLVDKKLIPKARADLKSCGKIEPETLCNVIATAHKVDFETFAIGRPDVDEGKKGWDTAFGDEGDTWFTDEEGDSETRKVSAKAGSKLTLFCAIHPEMVKTLKVTK